MKKMLLLICPMLALLTMVGCSSTDYTALISSSIVEKRDSYFTDNSDTANTTFVCGEREDPYSADGIISTLVPFGILTFTPVESVDSDTLNYYIMIDNIEYTGTLEKSMFNNSYSADIEKLTDSNAQIDYRVYTGDYEYQNSLICVSDGFVISQNDAIIIAADSLSSSLDNIISDNTLYAEVYIKIWQDSTGESNEYYWYIGIVGETDNYAVLLDANTGEILSIKD